MTAIKGTNIAGTIVPYDTSDTYATHDAQYGRGGFRAVATRQDLDAIPLLRLSRGMRVRVLADSTPSNNTDWEYLDSGWTKSQYVETVASASDLAIQAKGAAQAAALAATQAANIYPDIDTALGDPLILEGDYFSVPSSGDTAFTLYRKVNGSATLVVEYPSKTYIDKFLGEVAQTFYVTMTGSDDNSGKNIKDSFRSIEKACQTVRALQGDTTDIPSPTLGINVASYVIIVHPGTYEVSANTIIPRNTTLYGYDLRSTKLSLIRNSESKFGNMFLLSNGCKVRGFSFTNLMHEEPEDLDQSDPNRYWYTNVDGTINHTKDDDYPPKEGFAFVFRPGEYITRSPYLGDCSQIHNFNYDQMWLPIDRLGLSNTPKIIATFNLGDLGRVNATSFLHGFPVGSTQHVTISGTTNYNGDHSIYIIDENTFSFESGTAPISGEKGTYVNKYGVKPNPDMIRGGGNLLADGSVLNPNSPLRSVVVDSFTAINPNGYAYIIKRNAFVQLVSVFTNWSRIGLWSLDGGHVTVANSNTTFGDWALAATGFRQMIKVSGMNATQLADIRNRYEYDFEASLITGGTAFWGDLGAPIPTQSPMVNMMWHLMKNDTTTIITKIQKFEIVNEQTIRAICIGHGLPIGVTISEKTIQNSTHYSGVHTITIIDRNSFTFSSNITPDLTETGELISTMGANITSIAAADLNFEKYTRRDAVTLLRSISYDLRSGQDRATRSFVEALFDWNAIPFLHWGYLKYFILGWEKLYRIFSDSSLVLQDVQYVQYYGTGAKFTEDSLVKVKTLFMNIVGLLKEVIYERPWSSEDYIAPNYLHYNGITFITPGQPLYDNLQTQYVYYENRKYQVVSVANPGNPNYRLGIYPPTHKTINEVAENGNLNLKYVGYGSSNRIGFSSLIEATGQQFSYAGSGVNYNALPSAQRGTGISPDPITVIRKLRGGRIYATFATEAGDTYLGPDLRVDFERNTIEGQAFSRGVQNITLPIIVGVGGGA